MKFVKVEIAEPIYIPADWPDDSESATAQVFPVLFSGTPSIARKHFVICAYFPLLDQAQRESMASHLCLGSAGVTCDFIIHDTEGKATIVANIGNNEASAFESAAAVAVVKASCGWDESDPIMVRVNDIEVSVVAQLNGSEWIASVSHAD